MSSQLAPGLLVAAPGMSCPFFNHTVILLVEHGEDGALGFVVNQPTEQPVTSLMEGLEIDDLADEIDGEVWVGGPVAPDTGWVLFDPTSGKTDEVDALRIAPRVAVSASRIFLEQIAEGGGPERYAVLLGYAGWGPDQLDDELREGSWIPIDIDPKIIFDLPPEERWSAALATLGIDPARFGRLGVAEA